jgi:hypothetical protein
MDAISAPAAGPKPTDRAKAVTSGLRLMDRLSAFESPLVQALALMLAAAMATVLATTLIKLVAVTFAQS